MVFFAVIFLCGGIATWFSTKNKIRYGIYYGVIVAVIYGAFYGFSERNSITLILILIIGGMGSYIAKNERNTLKFFK